MLVLRSVPPQSKHYLRGWQQQMLETDWRSPRLMVLEQLKLNLGDFQDRPV